MKKSLVLGIVLMLALVAPLMAEEMILEAQSKVAASGLQTCDNLHHIGDCTVYHVTKPPKIDDLPIAELNDQKYVINWMGPGYYLEGGLVIQAAGDAESINGQQWLQVSPQLGQIHTSASWNDADGNGALSISDSIVIDGKELRIKDVRLQLRVSPLLQ
jgi:hypothetical protein